ncbi:hypothetical protein AGMMS49965_04960 [Bacteroidia bacterium]|nr:hypothetical protein AGMMS49965_04960 [Bacteroidia bacterium]
MKFDSEPYKVQFVQKSSPTRSDDFLFAEIYKFFTDKKLKYIVRAELYENNTFTVKYYAAIHKYLDDKYSVLTHQQDAHRIFITCFAIFKILSEKYPDASFAVNGSCSVDAQHNKIEGENRNQRYRIYSYVIDRLIGRETFAHYILPELSSYVLVNRVNKDTEAQRDAIKEMFLNLFDFDTDL